MVNYSASVARPADLPFPTDGRLGTGQLQLV